MEALRAVVDVPVESFDERFTTALAAAGPSSRAPEDARAAAHLLESYLTWASRDRRDAARGRSRDGRRRAGRRAARSRRLLVGFLALALWLGIERARWRRGRGRRTGGDGRAPTPSILRVVFPEGFTRKEMVERVAEVRQIAKTKRKVTPKLSGERVCRRRRRRRRCRLRSASTHAGSRASSSRRRTSSRRRRPAKKLVADQIEHFDDNWAKVDLRFSKTKNLTPYDVLIIASMVEKETIAPDERPKVAAVIYNRLKAGMPLGIDATIRYGLDVPGTEALRVSQLESDNPYNTRNRTGLPPTPIANPGLASMQAAAHPAKVNYLFFVRKPDRMHHFFTASESEFFAKACEYGYGCG